MLWIWRPVFHVVSQLTRRLNFLGETLSTFGYRNVISIFCQAMSSLWVSTVCGCLWLYVEWIITYRFCVALTHSAGAGLFAVTAYAWRCTVASWRKRASAPKWWWSRRRGESDVFLLRAKHRRLGFGWRHDSKPINQLSTMAVRICRCHALTDQSTDPEKLVSSPPSRRHRFVPHGG